MDESDRLSLLALIIAVVALIVSAWQLAQQLFATATDGKRYCQASVMGIWARKTRLSWRWSQIRFETKYTTPEIRLTSGIWSDDLASKEEPKPTVRLMYRIPGMSWLTEVFNGPASDWNGYFEVTTDYSFAPLELRKTRSSDGKVAPNSRAEDWSLSAIKLWDRSYREDSPDIVSWPRLLRSIHANQVQSIRKIQQQPAANGEKHKISSEQVEKGLNKSDNENPHAPMLPEERERGEDRVTIRLVERSWDLIPPDVVRPLAKSTVGTVVVLAHRLGMSWLGDFDPSDGKMNAAGSGHTFTSETVRGLGMVLEYNFHTESKKVRNALGSRRGLKIDEYLAPTETVDKLHCGAVPIDVSAVPYGETQEDVHVIDTTRKVDMKGLLMRLGVSSPEYDTLRKRENLNSHGSPTFALKHAIEEAVSLLCPIPVLADSETRWIVWPFRNLREPYTPLRQRPGLKELRDRLAEYMLSNKPGVKIMEARKGTVLQDLRKSPLEYLDALLKMSADLRQHRNTSHPLDNQEICDIYEQILDIHHQTSDVFANVKSLEVTDEDDARPFFLDLVGAQVTLATKHGPPASSSTLGANSGADETWTSDKTTRMQFVKELARLYVDDLENGQKTVRKHLRAKGYMEKLKPGDVQALWWTLMLRGACWWASVRVRLPETQIPSYWYNSQTPVYIT